VISTQCCTPRPTSDRRAVRGPDRHRPVAVRHHDRLPLPVRPDHDRPLGDGRRLPDRVAAHP
jgi:hypothetical protein